jgi:hypothetical protein
MKKVIPQEIIERLIFHFGTSSWNVTRKLSKVAENADSCG